MAKFTTKQWEKIRHHFDKSAREYGLPARRRKSVVIGSFNIRKLGAYRGSGRTKQGWRLLVDIIKQFDLIAIQEVLDDLTGLEYILSELGNSYGMVVSDITGSTPGKKGNTERLAFVFNWRRIERTALASDITFDRSEIAGNLYTHRSSFSRAWREHTTKLNKYEAKKAANKAAGKKAPKKPQLELPRFVSFIRQPHCASFQVKGKGDAKPYEFLIVNCHLMFGQNKHEREWEFRALLEWLAIRAKYIDKLYHKNLLLLGDCNLDFASVPVMREDIDALLKGLNQKVLKSKKAANANFPMLSPHPEHGILRTALRLKDTYDQIGFFSNDKRLPIPDDNKSAGTIKDGYDYGVFNIANLISEALHGDLTP